MGYKSFEHQRRECSEEAEKRPIWAGQDAVAALSLRYAAIAGNDFHVPGDPPVTHTAPSGCPAVGAKKCTRAPAFHMPVDGAAL